MSLFETLTVIAAAITAIATSLLALFAYTAFKAAVAQLELLRADSARQTRPYVQVDLAPGLHGIGYWDITVENTGKSTAREVRINAGLLTPKDGDDHISADLADFLAVPFTLQPGARRRVMWRMEADENHPVAGADDHVDVQVTYADDTGGTFSDQYPISVRHYARIAPAPSVGAYLSGRTSKPVEEHLHNINNAIRELSVHLGLMRS
jgi:hypothetical protein